ncbi:hypothetical protein C8A00DRAFT_38646 [Chaetomidium leptoderma]|uniref:Ketoreductase (KR) domain-containing protein n=1 Tax=Chaetomidium leptoderma TaxID=669021 RepID=A0AAN6VC69_9PEZI|nr:hypothetical protein C8A00DRAFT_38646 [Chaetomidium leptoderma]
MTGTIIITGANGSLAIPAVEHLLTRFPAFTLVLAVRNPGDDDVNTKALGHVISKHNANKRASIRKLDLASLKAVHEFANAVTAEVAQGTLPPLASIVCNAFYWNLTGPLELTSDGYEKTVQIIHLSHVALVLRLLGSFGPDGGRVVLFSSDATVPGKNNLESIPPKIPTDPDGLEQLVHPAPDDAAVGDNMAHGFCRYATAKLAVDAKLNKITVVIFNPGNLSDSRALLTNTPRKLVLLARLVVRPLAPLLRLMDATARTAAEAGADAARLAANAALPGERGYFTLLNKDEGAADSRDEPRQEALWARSAQWAGVMGPQDTALAL